MLGWAWCTLSLWPLNGNGRSSLVVGCEGDGRGRRGTGSLVGKEEESSRRVVRHWALSHQHPMDA